MKYLMLFIFAAATVSANDPVSEREWVENVVSVLLDQKEATVYAAGPDSVAVVKVSPLLRKKADCMTAEIILADDDTYLPERCKAENNRILYRSYSALKRDRFALGAVFRHKGRQNLLFVRSRIDHFGITLPATHRRYLESR